VTAEVGVGLISAYDRVQEHPEVWTQRLSQARWGDRIPHLERQRDGGERWVVDGRVLPFAGVSVAGAAMPDRNQEPQQWADVPAVAYDPKERLAAMDADGVAASVLYPTVAGASGETFGSIADPELELACVQAYNDWLIEEWAAASERFVPLCIVPLYPAEAAAQEIRRAVAMGHRGVIYPPNPMELRDVPHVNEMEYEPLWATCEELGVPLCIHAGSSPRGQFAPYSGFSPTLAAALGGLTQPTATVFVLVNLTLSRILLRHPGLKVVFAESGLGWAAYLMEYADHQFEKDRLPREGYELTPSEQFRRQCFLTTSYEQHSLQTRGFIGTENILWSANFPQANSTWPDSQAIVERCFGEIPEAERRRMLGENAAGLFRW
jgi:uncharacterized protein